MEHLMTEAPDDEPRTEVIRTCEKCGGKDLRHIRMTQRNTTVFTYTSHTCTKEPAYA